MLPCRFLARVSCCSLNVSARSCHEPDRRSTPHGE
jgi:hypothetical protein